MSSILGRVANGVKKTFVVLYTSTLAKNSIFDPTGTSLSSTNAEDAIKEVDAKVTVETVLPTDIKAGVTVDGSSVVRKQGNMISATIIFSSTSAINNGEVILKLPTNGSVSAHIPVFDNPNSQFITSPSVYLNEGRLQVRGTLSANVQYRVHFCYIAM